MIYRKYGPKKINLSVIGLGGIVVKDTNPFEAEEIIEHAHNNGVNYFDVAPGYGIPENEIDWVGLYLYRNLSFSY